MNNGERDTAVLSFYVAFGCMQGILSFDERLRRVRESLPVEKAAHAATREKLHDCETELARMQGRGETEGAVGEGRKKLLLTNVMFRGKHPLLLVMTVGEMSGTELLCRPIQLLMKLPQLQKRHSVVQRNLKEGSRRVLLTFVHPRDAG